MTETRVGSWTELNERLYEGSYKAEIRRNRSTLAFRGVSSTGYSLTTSLVRLGGSYVEMEQHLLRNFRKYARLTDVPQDSVWNWLALAQHHGLPTRLLDWTYSPFIAMHFVTETMNCYGRDGAIWCIHHGTANQHLPDCLRQITECEGSAAFSVDMLEQVADSLSALEKLARDPFVLFLEPPSLDTRITNQYALFSLMSSPTALLHEWLADHPDLFRRIIVPAELKWEVRDKLDQANMNERMLYPGLDGLAKWLTRYYTPKSRLRSGLRHNGEPNDQ